MMPAFTDPAVAMLWHAYLKRIDKLVDLAGPGAADIRTDLEAHLLDGFDAAPGMTEAERMRHAIARLGEPEDYLRPLVADGLIDRAAARLDPVSLTRGLYHAVRLGSLRMIVGTCFAIGYSCLLVFAGMALARPFWGGHVGLYRWPDGTVEFGFLRDVSGAADVLGGWTTPLALGATAILYLLLTKGLGRLWKRIR